MDFALTVILASRNPVPQTLHTVLEALRSQTASPDAWELLCVDNGSDSPLSGRFDLNWHPHSKWLMEKEPSQTMAQIHGIQQTSSRLLLLVDDDNVLAPDYIQQTLRISAAWPQLGAWGGVGTGRFELPPADWTRKHWPKLAINNELILRDRWSNCGAEAAALPFGAGMTVRREVAELWISKRDKSPLKDLLGRKQGTLASASDLQLALSSLDLGLGTGIFTNLKFEHVMPASRLTEEYLLRLEDGIAFSDALLRWERGQADIRPLKSRIDHLVYFLLRLRMNRRDRAFLIAKVRAEARAAQLVRGKPLPGMR